jgi:hypothetical protein
MLAAKSRRYIRAQEVKSPCDPLNLNRMGPDLPAWTTAGAGQEHMHGVGLRKTMGASWAGALTTAWVASLTAAA